jgi:hypothetical protein
VTKKHQMTELDTSALTGMPVGISRSPLPLEVPDARRAGDACRAERCGPPAAGGSACKRLLKVPQERFIGKNIAERDGPQVIR